MAKVNPSQIGFACNSDKLIPMSFSKIILRIELLITLVRLMLKPEKTELVFQIADALRMLGAFGETRARITADAGAEAMVKSRAPFAKIDLAALARLPVGTLGQVYAEHMQRLGLDPNFYPELKVDDDPSYIVMRMRQTHDLWHVVTGFDTEVAGELGLQAFMLAYLALPLPVILVGGGLLKLGLLDHENLGNGVQAITRGMTMGQAVRGLFAYNWAANWAKPLAEVRRELKIGV